MATIEELVAAKYAEMVESRYNGAVMVEWLRLTSIGETDEDAELTVDPGLEYLRIAGFTPEDGIPADG